MKKAKKGGVLPPQTAADIELAVKANQVAGAAAPAAEVKPVAALKPPEPPKRKAVRTETIRVRHDFTSPELLAIGQTMAEKKRVHDATKAELKTITRQYNATLSGLDCDINSAGNKISDGYEMREVEAVVMLRIDKKKKTATKYFYRKDDGSFIKHEPAINTELELFNVLPDKANPEKSLPMTVITGQV